MAQMLEAGIKPELAPNRTAKLLGVSYIVTYELRRIPHVRQMLDNAWHEVFVLDEAWNCGGCLQYRLTICRQCRKLKAGRTAAWVCVWRQIVRLEVGNCML